MSAARKVISNVWHFLGRHAYFVVIRFFIVVVGFLDTNSYYHRFLHHEEIRHLQNEIKHYQDIYDRDTKTLKQLEADPSAMEKVARERYFMKRPTEDVYIIK